MTPGSAELRIDGDREAELALMPHGAVGPITVRRGGYTGQRMANRCETGLTVWFTRSDGTESGSMVLEPAQIDLLIGFAQGTLRGIEVIP